MSSGLLDHPLLFPILTLIFSSLSFGVMGSWVVVQRLSNLTGSVAHSILGGIGIGVFLEYTYQMSWPGPNGGAVIFALLVALVISYFKFYAREHNEGIIAVLWSVGMSLGLIFLYLTPVNIDPMSFLFGNVLLAQLTDVYLSLGWGIGLCIISSLFFKKWQLISFDPNFAQAKGINVKMHLSLLLVLASLSIVVFVKIVGVVMVIALLVLPAMLSAYWVRSLVHMMITACFVSLIFNLMGFGVSYWLDIPTGPAIILSLASCYFLFFIFKGRRLS